MADDRVIAVCEGGPLNGVLLSAPTGVIVDGELHPKPLSEGGEPQPLTSRQEVVGVLYVPKKQIPLEDKHQVRTVTVDGGEDVDVPLFGLIEHDQAWLYVPEDAT